MLICPVQPVLDDVLKEKLKETYSALRTYLLTYPWSTVLLEKLTGSQIVKKFPAFYGTRRFITAYYRVYKCSSPVHILSKINPVHALTPHFLMIHLNIILPSMPESSKQSLSLRFLHQNPVRTSPLPHTCYMPCPFPSSDLINWIIFGEEYRSASSPLHSQTFSISCYKNVSPSISLVCISYVSEQARKT